jgi:hypothetical protein
MAQIEDTELKDKVDNEPDFVNLKRYNYSLERLLERYQDSPIPDRVVAQALNLTEQELNEQFARLVTKLRDRMGVTL